MEKHQTIRRGLAGLVLWLAASAAAFAQTPTELRTLGGITEYRLDNGLQVLLMPQAGAPRISVTVTYRVGSRNEGAGEAGMAHLLEHVTFRGTAAYPDLGAEMQRLGISFNGTTSLDRTNYSGSFAAAEATGADTLRQLLKLEASRMQDAQLAPADFAKEKPLVLNEMGLRANSVGQRLYQGLSAAAFRQHAYGRPVIGFEADIEQLSLATLQAFYRRHYRPDKAVLMLAGGFEPGPALAAVVETFGPLRRPDEPGDTGPAAEPQQQAPRLMTLRTRASAVGVAWRVPGMAHEHAAALSVLGQLLPRLTTRLTSKPGERPFTQTLLSGGQTRDPHLLGLVVELPRTRSDTAEERRALEELEDQWVERLEAVGTIGGADRLVRQTAETTARNLRETLRNPVRAPALISDAVGAGDWRLPFMLADRLDTLKPAEVYRVADRYLRPNNRSIARGVTDATLPREALQFEEKPLTGISGWFARPAEVAEVRDPGGNLDAIKPLEGVQGGEAFQTDPAALERLAHRYLMPSGIRVGVLERKTPEQRVAVLLHFRWGRAEDMARLPAWRALSGTLLEEGAAGRTADTIRQLKKALHAEIRVSSGPQSLNVHLSARQDTLGPALQLLKELLSEPALPDAAFAREQSTALARLASAERSAGRGAFERERQHRMAQLGLGPEDPGYQPSGAELAALWRGLTAAELRAFQARHWSANDLQVAVVGQAPERVHFMVESVFAPWKKPQAPAYERFAPAHKPVAGARFGSRVSEDQAGSAQMGLQQELALNRLGEDYFPVLVGVRILGGGGVAGSTGGSRLADRLRAQDALSYSVNAQLRVPSEGDRASLRLQASGAPQAALRVAAAMQEELTRLLAEGVSAAEVETVRERLRAEQRQRLSSEAGLAAALLQQLDRDLSFEQLLAQDEAGLAAVTPERVNEALRRLLKPEQWVATISGAASE